MNKRSMSIAIMFAVILLIAVPSFAKTKEQKQAEVRKNANETLARLYKVRPSAKATIKAAAGYAAFSNFGMKILVAGGGKGQGFTAVRKSRAEFEDARDRFPCAVAVGEGRGVFHDEQTGSGSEFEESAVAEGIGHAGGEAAAAKIDGIAAAVL